MLSPSLYYSLLNDFRSNDRSGINSTRPLPGPHPEGRQDIGQNDIVNLTRTDKLPQIETEDNTTPNSTDIVKERLPNYKHVPKTKYVLNNPDSDRVTRARVSGLRPNYKGQ